MNAAHWHLVLNHFPIIGTLIGTLVLITGILLKGDSIKKTGLFILAIAAILAFPTHETGEEAEDIVEETTQVSHALIHEHEELAESFNIMAIALILLAGGSLFLIQRRLTEAKYLVIATAIVAIGASIWLFKIGQTGGEIMHQEIIKLHDSD